jgi:hypothetical protein
VLVTLYIDRRCSLLDDPLSVFDYVRCRWNFSWRRADQPVTRARHAQLTDV